ncbi:MAG TPA: serine hydrolase domain-containing protein [Thermoanaerobaculia bacterium]|nr:serine hydrolase domain-containing protein [Thermoanaerobaculia bacterium]
MKSCKPAVLLTLALICLLTSSVFAQLTTAPPFCPNPGEPPLPAECNLTATNYGWGAAINCLNALTRTYPQFWPGAIIGYQKDWMANPVLYANGTTGSGFETGDASRIASIASMTKPIVYAAGLKLIQDHMDSPDCAFLPDGTRNARCIFPNGVDSRLNIVLLRLDKRNGTDIWSRWFNNEYLRVSPTDVTVRESDVNNYNDWKHDKLRIRHLFTMTSGFPTLQFMGELLCGDESCPRQKPGDVLCPPSAWNHAAPHTSQCGYSLLYNRYLELRGGNGSLPDSCRPRPTNGPRLFDFNTYYGGVVYDPTRMQQKFERRYVGTPFVYNECVYVENPANGAGSWIDGRTATTRDVAQFYLGVPLQYEPGTRGSYAQANLAIVALLIEELSGISFNAYVKQKLLAPIGMTDTFFVPEKDRPSFAPGGVNHFLSHGSTDPNDHTNDEGGSAAQFARILDVKRVPTTPRRDIPDVAPGLWPNVVLGPDRHWDEGRQGWKNLSPEGGAFSTARDVLAFLRFLSTGKVGEKVILNTDYLNLLTKVIGPNSQSRTYGFVAAGNRIGHHGFFGSVYERDKEKKLNTTVIAQNVLSTPHGGEQRVPLCEFQYNDRQRFLDAIETLLQSIP